MEIKGSKILVKRMKINKNNFKNILMIKIYFNYFNIIMMIKIVKLISLLYKRMDLTMKKLKAIFNILSIYKE